MLRHVLGEHFRELVSQWDDWPRVVLPASCQVTIC